MQGLPGIGRESAVRLLNKFGSFEAVITAERHELQAVEGIGDTVADGTKSAVNEQIGCYGIDEDFNLILDSYTRAGGYPAVKLTFYEFIIIGYSLFYLASER